MATFLGSALGGASRDRVHDAVLDASIILLGLLRKASGHVREIQNLSNEKIKE